MVRWELACQVEATSSPGLQFADVMDDKSQRPAESPRTEVKSGQQSVQGGAYKVSGSATLDAWKNSDVIATDNSTVNSGDDAVIQANDHSKVRAGGRAKI